MACMLYACTKMPGNQGIASLNVINAAPNVSSAYVYFSFIDSNYYLQYSLLSYGKVLEYGKIGGLTEMSIVSSADTTKPLLQTSLHLKAGKFYSFYMAGLAPQPDTLVAEDILPVYTDSSAGVRFVNLTTDKLAISVNRVGDDPGKPIFSNLGYKQISDFRTYAYMGSGSAYRFEVRDQDSGGLLTTYSWKNYWQRNNTLVISGSRDPASGYPLTVFAVNNF